MFDELFELELLDEFEELLELELLDEFDELFELELLEESDELFELELPATRVYSTGGLAAALTPSKALSPKAACAAVLASKAVPAIAVMVMNFFFMAFSFFRSLLRRRHLHNGRAASLFRFIGAPLHVRGTIPQSIAYSA